MNIFKTLCYLLSILLSSPTVTAKTQKDFAVSFSPDGKKIVYYSYRGNELPDLFIADSNGENEKQLTFTTNTWEIMPKWSPNGKLIVFSAGSSMQDLEIYTIKPDGSHRKQITKGQGKAAAAVWYPDGESIIYSRFIGNEIDIMSLDLKNNHIQNLTLDSPGKYTNPTWSLDGQSIAYTYQANDKGSKDLYLTDRYFSHHKRLTEGNSQPGFLNWAPDSKKIIFSMNNNGLNNDLFTVNIKSGKITQLTNDRNHDIYFSAFSPNGKHLYMDIGDWQQNFFIYHSYWNGQSVDKGRIQVTGKYWVDEVLQLENKWFAPLIGKWQGEAIEGKNKGRYKEKIAYTWGPNQKSVVSHIDMYWDGNKFGEARGLLGLDWVKKQFYYNLVIDDGTVIMQHLTDFVDENGWKMLATSTGDGSRFPKKFNVLYKFDGNNMVARYFDNEEESSLRVAIEYSKTP